MFEVSYSATIVSSCQTISSPGLYELNQSLSSSSTCLTISSDNVTLDCKGYDINGTDAGGSYGVYITYISSGRDNETVKNCNINDFYYGLFLRKTYNSNFLNINFSSNTWAGIKYDFYPYNNLFDNIRIEGGSYGVTFGEDGGDNIFSNFFVNSSTNYGFYIGGSISSNGIKFINLTVINIGSVGIYASANYLTFINTSVSGSKGNGVYKTGFYFVGKKLKIYNSSFENNLNSDFIFSPVVSSESDCNGYVFDNLTLTGGEKFGFYNYSVNLENKSFQWLALCNADNSNLKNVTTSSSGINVYFTDNSNFTNINSSDNNYGFYSDSSNNLILTNSVSNSITISSGVNIVNSENLTMINVTANSNQGQGIRLYGVDLANLSRITVLNNRLENLDLIGDHGFFKHIDAGDSTSSDSILIGTTNSVFYNLSVHDLHSNNAIYLSSISRNNNISLVNLSKTTNPIQYQSGIKLSSSGNRFEDMSISYSDEIVTSSLTDPTLCNNYFNNFTWPNGDEIGFYNYSVNLNDRKFSQLILCNASNSILDNISITQTELYIGYTNNSKIYNINSSGNEEGIIIDESNNNSILNSTIKNNDDNGITISGYSENNIISNSDIRYNTNKNLYFSSSSSTNNIFTTSYLGTSSDISGTGTNTQYNSSDLGYNLGNFWDDLVNACYSKESRGIYTVCLNPANYTISSGFYDYAPLTLPNPYYIYPTPKNDSNYGGSNLTIKIDTTDAIQINYANVSINGVYYNLTDNGDGTWQYVLSSLPTNITSITFQAFFNSTGGIPGNLEQRTITFYPTFSDSVVPFESQISKLIGLIGVLFFMFMPFLSMKMKNKKAISFMVSTLLLLFVTVVAGTALFSWYTSYEKSYESKLGMQQQAFSKSSEIMTIKEENSLYYLYVRNFKEGYVVIDRLSINGVDCNLPQSNVILSSSVSKIEFTSCSFSQNSLNDVALFSKSGILNTKTGFS